MRKDCGDAAETVQKDYGVVTMRKYCGTMWKVCGDAAETVRKDYGSSADMDGISSHRLKRLRHN